jgi:transcriptional regulator with XRE-family HTH domain
MARNTYGAQRGKVVPPHVSLHHLRVAVGLTIDGLRDRISEATGQPAPTRGAISAVENGHRGASAEMLHAIALAYGLPDGAITTTYQPRRTQGASDE